MARISTTRYVNNMRDESGWRKWIFCFALLIPPRRRQQNRHIFSLWRSTPSLTSKHGVLPRWIFKAWFQYIPMISTSEYHGWLLSAERFTSMVRWCSVNGWVFKCKCDYIAQVVRSLFNAKWGSLMTFVEQVWRYSAYNVDMFSQSSCFWTFLKVKISFVKHFVDSTIFNSRK